MCTYSAIQLIHGFDCIVAVFKVYEAIVFNFLDSLNFTIWLEFFLELFFRHICFEISDI